MMPRADAGSEARHRFLVDGDDSSLGSSGYLPSLAAYLALLLALSTLGSGFVPQRRLAAVGRTRRPHALHKPGQQAATQPCAELVVRDSCGQRSSICEANRSRSSCHTHEHSWPPLMIECFLHSPGPPET